MSFIDRDKTVVTDREILKVLEEKFQGFVGEF